MKNQINVFSNSFYMDLENIGENIILLNEPKFEKIGPWYVSTIILRKKNQVLPNVRPLEVQLQDKTIRGLEIKILKFLEE